MRNCLPELKWNVDGFATYGGHGAVDLDRRRIAHHRRANVSLNNRIMGAVGVAFTQSGLIETCVDNEQSTRHMFLTL